MRSKKIISMFAALSLAVSCFVGFATGASAETTSATLLHTASYNVDYDFAEFKESTEPATGSSTVDAEYQNYHMFNSNNYTAVAYVEFQLPEIPSGDTITNATVTVNVKRGPGNNNTARPLRVQYVTNPGSVDLTNLSGLIEGLTDIETKTGIVSPTAFTEVTFDVSSAVNAAIQANSDRVILAFGDTNNGGTMYGKTHTTPPTLSITHTSEVLYNATINTNAYAKITIAENEYYADGSGQLTISDLSDGTVLNYTISKNDYTNQSGSITIDGDNAVATTYLTPADANVVYTENFDSNGLAERDALFNFTNSGGSGALLRYYNGGMEFGSIGNGERSGEFDFAPAIDVSSAESYKISFNLKSMSMSQSKSGTWDSEIDFVDSNDNVIFGILPVFTDGQTSAGLKVKAGTDEKVVTEENLGGKELKVEAVISDETVTVTVGEYDPVTLNQTPGTGKTITGMKNINNKLIFATLDDIVISKLPSLTLATADIVDGTDPEATTLQPVTDGTPGVAVDADTVITGTVNTLYIKVDNAVSGKVPTVTLTSGEVATPSYTDIANTIDGSTYFIYQFVGVDSLTGAVVSYDGATNVTVQ